MTNLTYDDINNESLEDLVKKYPKTNIESIKSLVGILEKNDKTINDAITAFNKKINKPDRDEIIYELSERYLPSYNVPMITPVLKPTPTPVPTTAPVPKLFTSNYINDTIFIDGFSINIDSVIEFIEDFAIDTRSEIILDGYKKANVYITSDLHGDYLRLLQHLINSEIISDNIQDSINAIRDDNVMKYISDFDYIIDEMKWIKQDCVLILNGDIIESCNTDNTKCLSYDEDYNELFIHIIIYNLRILAIKNNSIVKIVMGNHDFYLFSKDNSEENSGYVFKAPHPFKNDYNDIYDQYVSNRKILLSKFYNQSPLHILLKDNKGTTLATIVHGGIFNYDIDENQSNGKLLDLDYLNKANSEWDVVITENNTNSEYASTYFKHLWSRPPKMSENTTNPANYTTAVSDLKNTYDYGQYLIFGHSIVAKKNNDKLATIIKDGKIIYVDMGVSTTKNISNKNIDFEILHIDFNEDPNKLEGISTIGKNRIITGGIIGGASKQCVYMIIIVILLLFLVCIIYKIIVRVEVPLVKDHQFV